jgi:hypothetical protein
MDLDYGSETVAAKKSQKPRLVSSDEIELEENDAPTPTPFNAEEAASNLFFPHYRFKDFLN